MLPEYTKRRECAVDDTRGDFETDSAIARTDEQLLDDHSRGEPDAFAQLVQRYERPLFNFLLQFLKSRESAEDVFQETFLKVHQSANQFDPQRRFRPWLFTIAANKARDLLRQRHRQSSNQLNAAIDPSDQGGDAFISLMPSTSEVPGQQMEEVERRNLVNAAVAQMPDRFRELLLLSYFQSFPYKQISEILHIPLGTVKSRLHSAVMYFGERWKALEENSSARSCQAWRLPVAEN